MQILVIPLKFLLLYCFWSSSFFDVDAASETPCPPGCFCDNDGEWRCVSNNLVRIPSPLPENITSLVLTSQNIPTIYRNDFSGVQRLLKIQINRCNVLNIENGTFENLTELEMLNLDSNRLTTIDVNLFRGLHSLRFLDLSYNDIIIIQNGSFTDLPLLNQLNMRGNNLENLTAGTFSGLHYLTILYLYYNDIDSIENGTFIDLYRLEYLQLSGNDLKYLSVDTFNGLHSLNILYIDSSNIDTIENGTFLYLNNLRDLYLGSNRLKHLSAGIFSGLHNLENLYLSKNDIESIEDGTFEPLTKLLILDLQDNKLTHVNASTLHGPEQLTKLYLHLNELTSLQIPKSFSQTLRTLHLGDNRNLSFAPSSLGNVSNLQTLYVQRTSVNFSLDLFFDDDYHGNYTIPPLTTLHIENSSTNMISLDLLDHFPSIEELAFSGEETYVENGALGVLQQLRTLFIHQMPSSLHQQSFVNPLPRLETISIYYLKLKTIPTPFISTISKVLANLDFYYCQFQELPSEAFGNISSLNRITIQQLSPEIVSVDKDALMGVPNIRSLYLRNLKLAFLPDGLFDHTPSLSNLDLNGTQLSCNCSMEWLLNFIETQDVSVTGHCFNPPVLSGIALSTLTTDDLNCFENTTTEIPGSTDTITELSNMPSSQRLTTSATTDAIKSTKDVTLPWTTQTPGSATYKLTVSNTPSSQRPTTSSTTDTIKSTTDVTTDSSNLKLTTDKHNDRLTTEQNDLSTGITHTRTTRIYQSKVTTESNSPKSKFTTGHMYSSISTSGHTDTSTSPSQFPMITSILLVVSGLIIIALALSLASVVFKWYYSKRERGRSVSRTTTSNVAKDIVNDDDDNYEVVDTSNYSNQTLQWTSNIPLKTTETSTGVYYNQNEYDDYYENNMERRGSSPYQNVDSSI
ncbi:hypothetical protein BSL78_21736 [Apostichopus japonicus]|uniref:Uncharacterized protein n=1 Tax=Stichopus japonicus TaxID=307972 RepID=A0A2G8K071_STIJA|nr:hypothetical protein BSL78_21736 [Apostichopus japonicus]